MTRREKRNFFISVEGEVCEKMYFEHLERLIKNSSRSKYIFSATIKSKQPYEFAKSLSYLPQETGKSAAPYMHINDIENYSNDEHRKKFNHLIDQIEKAKKTYGISYMLGYSNYTFEVWMLLHRTEKCIKVSSRDQYLHLINNAFGCSFRDISEYKSKAVFEKVLKQITLDNVEEAIRRAEDIERANEGDAKSMRSHNGTTFYVSNPYTTVHQVVKKIFETCELQ